MYQAGCSLLSVKCDKDIHLPADKGNAGGVRVVGTQKGSVKTLGVW